MILHGMIIFPGINAGNHKKNIRNFFNIFFYQTSLNRFKHIVSIFSYLYFMKGIHMLEINSNERFLRLTDVIQRTGLSRSTIYLNISKGLFPKNISLGSRSVGWLESEINEWIKERVAQRNS